MLQLTPDELRKMLDGMTEQAPAQKELTQYQVERLKLEREKLELQKSKQTQTRPPPRASDTRANIAVAIIIALSPLALIVLQFWLFAAIIH